MRTLISAAAALAAAGIAASAAASPIDFHGYFRSGGGSSDLGGKEVCFRLPGSVVWFRLGNECDTYASLTLASELGKVDGTTFRAQFTTAYGTQQLTNWEQTTPALREAFVEAGNLGASMGMPALNGATLWAGKRFTNNEDIHMLDYAYLDSAWGGGAGLNDVNLGFAKLSYAYLRTDQQDWAGAAASGSSTGDILGSYRPGIVDGGAATNTTHDFRLRGIKTNPGGSLNLNVDLVQANNRAATAGGSDKPGKNGWSTTLTHVQEDLFGLGGFNKLGLQYASGAAGLKLANSPAYTTEGHKALLVFDNWVVEPKGLPFTMSAIVGYRDEKQSGPQQHFQEVFFGARPQYHLNNVWSVMSEVGYQEVKPEDGGVKGDTRKLAKLTLGTQFSMGRSIWSRPAIRFYSTYAKWNGAAAAAGSVACTGRDCNTPVTAYGDKRSGLGYGVQVEAWW